NRRADRVSALPRSPQGLVYGGCVDGARDLQRDWLRRPPRAVALSLVWHRSIPRREVCAGWRLRSRQGRSATGLRGAHDGGDGARPGDQLCRNQDRKEPSGQWFSETYNSDPVEGLDRRGCGQSDQSSFWKEMNMQTALYVILFAAGFAACWFCKEP